MGFGVNEIGVLTNFVVAHTMGMFASCDPLHVARSEHLAVGVDICMLIVASSVFHLNGCDLRVLSHEIGGAIPLDQRGTVSCAGLGSRSVDLAACVAVLQLLVFEH